VLTIVCRTTVSNSLRLIVMSSTLLKKFGNRIRDERIKRGLSQERLGELAKVHRTYVGMIERAEKNITLTNIEKLAKALNLDIRQLF
jgi:transcriptional regulator with XRE-family HTH domain